MLLTYLLLEASHHRGPLALTFIDLKKAHDRLPRAAPLHVLTEELEVPIDIRAGMEALYYQTWSVFWGEGGSVCCFRY